MLNLHRRGFLAALAVSAVPSFARTLKTVGVQLYTLRTVLPQKPLETLKALEEIGFTEAEVIGGSLDAIWPSLMQTKLKPVSVHLDTALFTTNQDKLPAALDDAKKRGLKFAVCPYIAPKDRGGVDVIKKLGETLNKAGETCAKSGLSLCYHNHAFEFEPAAGGTLLDVLMQTTDPKYVSLELDIMWSKVGGHDPVEILKKYNKRIALMHLKNVAAGVGPQFNEKVAKEAFKEVGNGSIDIPAVLKAASEVGVKHYFVEQDQTPGNPLDSLKQSFEYLKKTNF
ncbi:sugar phosphate isomerase/epimerase family protein [Paludibaculum fermentans]|uniref:TIM barrel protein n=1 Tax=Paludibaculum fermentans TaxID=1473598 RepID=A0A7S7NN08_PALFE|nr:sugar phosphate isomerase/epimerase [Paludibaculum fermentans]QOY86628.1 TIM barrel protein [Paludibaculum fermentans]